MLIVKHRLCLERLGVVTKEDQVALVVRVFWRCGTRLSSCIFG